MSSEWFLFNLDDVFQFHCGVIRKDLVIRMRNLELILGLRSLLYTSRTVRFHFLNNFINFNLLACDEKLFETEF